MKTEKHRVQNLVAKYAHKVNRHAVHENKKRQKDLTYWRNQPKSTLNELI
jgi:hypothetical protein